MLDAGGSVLRALGHRTDGVYFATPDQMTRRLQTAGFEQVHAWLQAEPTPPAPGEPLESATGDPEIAGGNRPSWSGRPDR